MVFQDRAFKNLFNLCILALTNYHIAWSIIYSVLIHSLLITHKIMWNEVDAGLMQLEVWQQTCSSRQHLSEYEQSTLLIQTISRNDDLALTSQHFTKYPDLDIFKKESYSKFFIRFSPHKKGCKNKTRRRRTIAATVNKP